MNTAEKESDDDRRISIICFSLTGKETAQKLKEGLEKCGYHTELYKKSRYLEDSIAESTADWTAEHFPQGDGLIFVGACGIAVRSIAPQVASKKSDPAVLVVDECGQFVISLLSGHLGGANELSLKAAQILGAQPVVTTATDLHKRFAVDVFSRKNDCEILFMKAAKEVSAALLAGKTVGFYSEFPFVGALPNGLTECDAEGIPLGGESVPEAGVAVTIHPSCRAVCGYDTGRAAGGYTWNGLQEEQRSCHHPKRGRELSQGGGYLPSGSQKSCKYFHQER